MDESSWIKEYGRVIVVAIALAFLIRFFVFEAYRIPSQAMRPTLESGDTIFVAKWPFGVRNPFFDNNVWTSARKAKIGEVVIFVTPGNKGREVVRRVLGTEEDVVGIEKGLVNREGYRYFVVGSEHGGVAQEKFGDKIWSVNLEPPLVPDSQGIKVPPGYIFVAGDNRTQPQQPASFLYGIVPDPYLRSKAMWIWLSLDPNTGGGGGVFGGFSKIRFERMFQKL